MAITGPKPKPTAIKILEGNPGKRPLNLNEPKPLQIAPECPDWLLDEAKKELKNVLDSKSIYWGGIRENFEKILENDEAIGRLAWKVFNDQSGKEASDEVKSLVYDGSKAPWKFTLMACVLYD